MRGQSGNLRRALLAAQLLTALVLGGCGGRGSSGFDIAPASEAEALARAMEGSCVEFEATTYCGSGVPVTVDGATARVEIADPGAPLPCARLPGDAGCATSVGFSPDGFAEETAYRVAHAETIEGPWTLAPNGDPHGGDVVVTLPDGSAGPSPRPLVVAVLVYLGDLPADLPQQAPRLSDFGADVAYVSAELTVVVPES